MTTTTKQIQLFLMPTPGAKPEFLATVEGTTSKSPLDSSFPDKIVLENYTRDPWAWKPNPSVWQSYNVKSVDGRNKLPGFLKYLKDRQKSAFGRFADKASILVISYIQKANSSDNSTATMMDCKFAWDVSSVPGCPMKPPPPPPLAAAAAAKPVVAAKPPAAPIRKGKAGLLGKLVSSQRQTNAHLQVAASSKPKQQQQQLAAGDATTTSINGTTTTAASANKKTAQQVMAEFRQKMEETFLDFDIAPEPSIKIQVSLAEHQKDLATMEDKARITMEILKYIVYEQAEEVNEEWVAHKEPGEFMDEMTIAVYKEGEAPPEVLEELNRGELPDEVKGQQQNIMAQQQNRADQKAQKLQMELQRKALQDKAADDEDEVVLNKNKRDRRTIEEIQRGDDPNSKKSRTG